MLLGASVSLWTVLAIGSALLLGIVAIVAFTIPASYFIRRSLDLSRRMAVLISCGNSICGNSAIAAVAPVIGANSEDVACSIAFTAVRSLVVVLELPVLSPLLGLPLIQYGVLEGLTVYAVPQALAATLPIGAVANQVGTVVKLVRVLMLGPVVLALALETRLFVGRTGEPAAFAPAGDGQAMARLAFWQFVPWFIVAFLILGTLRSMNVLPTALLVPTALLAGLLATVSMAALGLGVDVRVVARASLRVSAAVILSLIVLGAISLALIHVLAMTWRYADEGASDLAREWMVLDDNSLGDSQFATIFIPGDIIGRLPGDRLACLLANPKAMLKQIFAAIIVRVRAYVAIRGAISLTG